MYLHLLFVYFCNIVFDNYNSAIEPNLLRLALKINNIIIA